MKSFQLLMVLNVTGLAVVPVQGQDAYFPMRVGSEWHYKKLVAEDQKVLPGEGGTIVVRVARLDEVVFKEEKGKKETAQVYTLETSYVDKKNADKKLTEQVAVLPDGIYRFSSAGKAIKPPLPFLKKEQSWECDATTNDTPIKGTFLRGEDEISVPAGKFKTITASASKLQIGEQTMSVKYWFAPNYGIVKQYLKVNNYDVVLELQEYRPAK